MDKCCRCGKEEEAKMVRMLCSECEVTVQAAEQANIQAMNEAKAKEESKLTAVSLTDRIKGWFGKKAVATKIEEVL